MRENKFQIDDTVRLRDELGLHKYSGQNGSIINFFIERPKGKHFASFPDGVIYAVEFEDGEAVDIHESELVKID